MEIKFTKTVKGSFTFNSEFDVFLERTGNFPYIPRIGEYVEFKDDVVLITSVRYNLIPFSVECETLIDEYDVNIYCGSKPPPWGNNPEFIVYIEACYLKYGWKLSNPNDSRFKK